MRYEIRLAGHLERDWSDWFEGFTCTFSAAGETVLTGPVPDQSALVGLLAAVCGLNLVLVGVRRVE